MKMVKLILLITVTFLTGFFSGLYALPIISAPASPSMLELATATQNVKHTGQFISSLKDSDLLHFAKGDVSISPNTIAFKGTIAPGPDYKLYLAKEFVETEADFRRLKPDMISIADIKTFDSFIVNVPQNIDVDNFNTVIIWCESFSQFISAAQYRTTM
jgi:hypothetical protein